MLKFCLLYALPKHRLLVFLFTYYFTTYPQPKDGLNQVSCQDSCQN